MPERPHSRKKTIEEGTAEIKKGERISDSVRAGDGAPFAKGDDADGRTQKEDE